MILKDKQASVSKRFGNYKGEPLLESKPAIIKPDPVREAIHAAWRGMSPPGENRKLLEIYQEIAKSLEMTVWTTRHVEAFCLDFHMLRPDYTFMKRMGIFLSVLVNNAHGLDLTLDMGGSEKMVEKFGFMNIKNVEIAGDIGAGCGMDMIGGGITVHGCSGALVGVRMEGGKIIIEGSTGNKIGHYMTGGEIHIHGDYMGLGEVQHGRIFHKGRLILEK